MQKHAQRIAIKALMEVFPNPSEKEKSEGGKSCEIDIYEEHLDA